MSSRQLTRINQEDTHIEHCDVGQFLADTSQLPRTRMLVLTESKVMLIMRI